MLDVPSVEVRRANSMQLIQDGMKWMQSCDMLTIISYSITDGWLRQLMKLKNENGIKQIILVLDRTVIERHREKITQIVAVADELYLTDSHAKVYFMESDSKQLAIITSANATNNYRTECYYATDRQRETESIRRDIRTILSNAARVA